MERTGVQGKSWRGTVREEEMRYGTESQKFKECRPEKKARIEVSKGWSQGEKMLVSKRGKKVCIWRRGGDNFKNAVYRKNRGRLWLARDARY